MTPAPVHPADDDLARLLPADAGAGRRDPVATLIWDGVVWSRLGRGDRAWVCWDAAERAPQPRIAAERDRHPWIAAERGRVLRELGLHARAEALDLAGLEKASDPVDRAMLCVSLTADAVGRSDRDQADERLVRARQAVAAAPDGPRAARQRLRLAWVEIEVAYLTGQTPTVTGLLDPGTPRGAAEPDPDAASPGADTGSARARPAPRRARVAPGAGPVVLHPDHDHGTAFHRAKTLLFTGIVLGSLDLLDAAAAEAPPVLAWAVHLARADLGVVGALAEARTAWQRIVPPPHVAAEVAATPTARRLTAS